MPGVGTSWAPSAAPWNNHAIMVWNGVGDDTRIWTATCNPAVKKTNFTNPWSSQTLTLMPGKVPVTTGSAPAIASLGNKLIMVWRGVGENDSLYSAVSGDGVTWTKALPLPNAASTIAPAVTIFKGQAFVAFKGAKNDTGIFVAKYNDVAGIANGSWATRWNVPGIGTSHGPTLTTFNAKLFMSWKGAEDTDIWWSQSATGNPKDWSPQKPIDGGTTVGPTAMAF